MKIKDFYKIYCIIKTSVQFFKRGLMQTRGYNADWLYQLKQKNDIVSVVSRYVHLEKKGRKYWGCCPFHNEKTPSFSVSEEEGLFYCFGCKESGDVITFVMKIESCDFSDAVKVLADLAHMEVPEFVGDKDSAIVKQTKERLLKLLNLAANHYHENIYLAEAKPAQEYIKLRGFTRHELEDFKLGYALDWKEMISYLRKEGFTYKEMVDAGIAQKKDDRYFDVMGQRLIFPIYNSFGDCLGFSARVLGKTDFAKYKNTAETQLFHKGRVVFAINLVKKLKQTAGLNQIIIVEGQIDVIAMHRAGFKNTVACMGTALTSENAHELKKLSSNVILCFDGDEAGIKATMRSIDILKNEGFEIKIVAMPDKHDPDEILKEKGKEYLQNLIENALPVTDYLIEVEKKNYNLDDPEQKGLFASAVLEHIRKIDSLAKREPYLKKLRDLTDIPIDVLRRDLERKGQEKQREKETKKEDENVLTSRENGNIRAVKFVLSSLIHGKSYVDKNIDYRALMPQQEKIIEMAEKGIAVSSYFDYFDVENMPLVKDCLVFDFDQFASSKEQYFKECVALLAEARLKEKQSELTKQFSACTDNQKRMEIMKQLTEVSKQLREKSLEEFYVRKQN